MERGGIYLIRHKYSNKFYVGSTISFRRRKAQHWLAIRNGRGESKGLVNLANSLGNRAEDFMFEPLLICDPTDRKFYEQRILDILWGTEGCLNLSKNGGGHSDITCALISAKLKLVPRFTSTITRQRQRQAQLRRAQREGPEARRHSPETRLKISRGLRKHFGSHPVFLGPKQPSYFGNRHWKYNDLIKDWELVSFCY